MRFERYNRRFESAVVQLHRSALVGISHGYAQEHEEHDLREIDAVYLHRGGEFLLGFIENRLVAMGGFKIVGDGVAEVKRIRIAPELQGQGIGSALLGRLEALARANKIEKLVLESAASRPRTLAFWRKHGYAQTGEGIYGIQATVCFEKLLKEEPNKSPSYVQVVIHEFRRLKSLGDGAISQISAEQFFGCPSAGDNSIAIIVKHVSGNLVSRWTDFLTSDGEKPGRNRDTEFGISANDSRAQLLQAWEGGWMALFAALEPLRDSDLVRTVTIRGEALTVLQAVNRQLTHYAYHVGQIVYLAKHYCGPTWRTLSIPVGSSAEFNRSPTRYVPNA